MDYEKAYKAVLQTATQWIKDGCTDKEKICLECVFPELRESEDERIRKAIIYAIYQSTHLDGRLIEGITRDRALAWLEKQKEHKEELVYRLNGLMQEYINESKDEVEQKHRFKCYELFWDALEDTSYFDEQKEQKPVEWSEEDEKMLDSTLLFIDAHRTTHPLAPKCYDWLKSLRPQK